MSDMAETYLHSWVLVGSMECYIIVIACISVFVSRQSAFYYQLCFSMAIFLRFALRMSFRSSRPFMDENDVKPYECVMSYGTPDSSVMELVTMVVIIIKNPKSSISKKPRGSSELLQDRNDSGGSLVIRGQ